MTNVLHAHVLFELIDQYPDGLTEAELHEQATALYGADTVYTNCSGTVFTLAEVTDFFLQRAKVHVVDGRFQLNRGNICAH